MQPTKIKAKPGKGATFYARLLNPSPELLERHPELQGLASAYPGVPIAHNELTPGFSTLIARLCADPTEPAGGLTYCAFGSGDPGWDAENPPAAVGDETTLEAEFFRKAWASVTFVDEFGTPRTPAEAVSMGLNTVDFEVQLAEGEGTGSIMELGAFGGDATAALNSGTLCDYEIIERIPKPANAALGFVFRWEF